MAKSVKKQPELTPQQVAIETLQERITDIKFETVDVESLYKELEYAGNKRHADVLRLLLESIDSLQSDFDDLLAEID